jgi:signal transduction histidine kinase
MRRIGRNLREILAQGERAGVIIRRMRALAKGGPSRFGTMDLNDVVRNAIALVRWDLSQNEITLRLELAEGLPPAYADAIQIEQVLLNLIRNAIEAMRRTEAGPRLMTLRTAVSDGRVFVEVRDTGVGLPRTQEDRVFEPFFTTKPDGLGLGLSLCRWIVEGHRGTIEARSDPDAGAAFLVTLPARHAAGFGPDSSHAEVRGNEGKNIKDGASRCPIYRRGRSRMA